MGLAAKTQIQSNQCYISIPNRCIISVHRALNSDLRPWLDAHPTLFSKKHPDHEQLILCAYLCQQTLLGDKSFFAPYLAVMNTSDMVAEWSEKEQF